MIYKIIEKDEAGNLIHCYRSDNPPPNEKSARRAGTSKLSARNDASRSSNKIRALAEVFLPSGYPASVTPDYMNYQIYDSLQAFSSSIAGLLSSRAVLEGFGVGDQNASATHAMLLTIVQDATSRLATIVFAWRLGTALEPEAKMYRFAADIFNDTAILLDCLSPALPSNLRIAALCLSGSLRALCGVSAGGAKAALSVHFAKAGNVGELNAKDHSQETVIGLFGMMCGSFVISHITSRSATWTALLVLLAVHLTTNYLAVRSVVMTTLNRQRTNIVYTTYRERRMTLKPSQVARIERIFEYNGAIRNAHSGAFLGKCKIGSSFRMEALASPSPPSKEVAFGDLLTIFADEQYILWHKPPRSFNSPEKVVLYIWCKEEATPLTHLMAWIHTIEFAERLRSSEKRSHDEPLAEMYRSTLNHVQSIFPVFLKELESAGWTPNVGAFLTNSARTVSFEETEHSPMKDKTL
ncbi:DUF647-domain-containing protein [Rickenella mellea]|uniref:DUF647-domain-containing protein n=1 Tax=Rickenella mellea TaxID=50990 RepID=A0A4Y7QAB1_9AGAM|nr:DUF647-domain-containing protein [Rickenella mellea]